ncbi:MAG: gamma carbonic anhydrase family protein [Wolinella sp.]
MLLSFDGATPKIPHSVLVCEGSYIIGDVEIGEDSSVWFGAVIRGDVHKIRIGARVSVQDGSVLHVTHHTLPDKSDGNALQIGNDATIGHRVILHGCTIDSRVLVGMGAIVMDGAEIGSDSIIGAGAVVTKGKKFPPRSLILGSPASFIRTLSDEEVIEIEAHAHRYVEFQRRYTR